jgi:coatomer protein complex subunit alpha (xenin)
MSDPLAYLTAKTNGLDDIATEILEAAGLTEADVDDIPTFGASTLKPPPIVTSTTSFNWPSVSAGENFFDKALANGALEGGEDVPYVNGIDAAGAAASSALDAWAREQEVHEDIDGDDGGWELDAEGGDIEEKELDEVDVVVEDEDLGAGATPGVTEPELWVRNSPFAADHVAAGSFDSAMQVGSQLISGLHQTYADYIQQLLNRQLGVVHFSALRPLFLSIYRSSHTYLSPLPSLPPLSLHVRRNTAESSPSRVLPVAVRTLQSVRSELAEGYRFVSGNKLAEAQTTFRSVLQALLLVVVSSDDEGKEVIIFT